MKNDPDVYSICDRCSAPIMFGNAVVTIGRNIEQVDRDEEHPDGVVTVIDATVLITLCAACGNLVDARGLAELLSAAETKRHLDS